MIPVAAALAAGIVVSWHFVLPVWFTVAAAVVCAVTAAVTVDRSGAASVAALAAAMMLGMTASGLRYAAEAPGTGRTVCEVEITGHAALRDGRVRTTGELRARRSGDGLWRECRGAVIVAADSAAGICQGDLVVCRARIVPFGAKSGEYGRLMRRRGYVGSIFLTESDVLSRERCGGRLLPSLHERAVCRMARLPIEGRDLAVATALGTGDRSLLDRELRGEYSRAGMAHVLALSGLHVGIVLLLVDALLFWMPLLPAGHKLRCVAAVALLWGYVAVTGMAPSAVRAALMFSALQLSRLFSARYSGANALAAAAFVCLCGDPELLRDPGFQLSYVAVAGILAWGVPLCRLLHVSYDGRCGHDLRGRARNAACAALNMLTETVAVGVTASLAVAPLVSHLFGAIPVAGPAVSPAAVAAAAVVVLLSAVWLVLPFDAPAPLFGRIAESATGVLNSLSEWVSGLAWATVDVRLTAWQTAAAYAVMAAVTVCFAERRGENGGEWRLNGKKS